MLKWELIGFALRPGTTHAWENPHHTTVLFVPLPARSKYRKAALLQRMAVHCQIRGAWGCLIPALRHHHNCLTPVLFAASPWAAGSRWGSLVMLSTSSPTPSRGGLPLRLSLKQKTGRKRQGQQRKVLHPLSNSSRLSVLAGEVEDPSSCLS